jgi:glycosyltransferase involved in cell wall biosynthesis
MTRKLQVCYLQRRTRPTGNFSLELVFADVRKRLANQIAATLHVSPCHSNGVLRRLWIMLDAWWHQGAINHVTGDINFAAIPLNRNRTVLTILDCGDLSRQYGFRRTLLKLFWFDLPVRRARTITTISEASRNEIVKLTGCKTENVVVIPVAISDQFRYCPKAISTSRPRILQVGTAPNKNVNRLVQALDGIDCTLVILGTIDNELQASLERHSIEFENRVSIPLEEVVREYEAADIIAFASTFEGFGMPIVEAQTVGRPVVTSNCSSMPEVAGDAACLVDPFDVQSIRAGLQRVINDTGYRDNLVRKGIANAARFQPDQIAEQYLRVYQRLVE